MDHGPLDLKDLSQEGNLNFVIVYVETFFVLQKGIFIFCQATGTGTWDLGPGTWDLGLRT